MFFILLLFIGSIIAAVSSSYVQKRGKGSNRLGWYLAMLSGGLSIISILISMIQHHPGWPAAGIVILIANGLICVPNLLLYEQKNAELTVTDHKKLIRSFTVASAVILLMEVFLCNFGTFRLAYPSAPKEQQLSLAEAMVDGAPFGSDTVTLQAGESKTFSFDSINSEIDTIYADVAVQGEAKGTIEFAYSDETYKAGMRRETRLNYIQGDESSHYITCSFSGMITKLEFTLSAPSEGTVTLSSLAVNQTIPFHFSWMRVAILLIMVLFVVLLARSPMMRKSYQEQPHAFTRSAVFITAICMLLGCCLFLLRGSSVFELFQNPDTNQINKELVDAFRAGQVHLLDQPSEELLALSDPYDDSLRSANQAGTAWDHLLYDGKYYSYYGIGTVLTLFLPYHLITGNYFSSQWATFLYSIIGILFLSLAYCTFIKRLFPKTTNGIAVSGLVIVQASSFVWYCITIGNFYELAQVSGFAFLIAGTYFLLRSNVLGDGKISRVQICIATTLLAIAVLCRAALALYCIVSLLFLVAGVRKIVHTSEEKTYHANRKPIITFLLAAMIPYLCIGAIQMIYNYLRFGSVLDFGIAYSLTIYDYQEIQFHTPLMLIAIFNYLFTVPKVSSTFPFFTSNYDSLSVNGYYFLAGFSSTGLIFRAAPVMSFLAGPRIYRMVGKKRKLETAILMTGCLIVPFIQMAMIWQYGYTPRYAVDFAWEMLFGAFAIFFILYNSVSKPVQRILYNFMIAAAVFSVMINFALTYEAVLDYGNTYKGIPEELRGAMLSFGRLFEFWNIM